MRPVLLMALSWLTHAGVANASVFDLSALSRANCSGFNESVTWDASESWQMGTESFQVHDNGNTRLFETGPSTTWRSYAGCQLCGLSGWYVSGFHHVLYEDDSDKLEFLQENCEASYISSDAYGADPCWLTSATDCNLDDW
jgi:hypothetical protein